VLETEVGFVLTGLESIEPVRAEASKLGKFVLGTKDDLLSSLLRLNDAHGPGLGLGEILDELALAGDGGDRLRTSLGVSGRREEDDADADELEPAACVTEGREDPRFAVGFLEALDDLDLPLRDPAGLGAGTSAATAPKNELREWLDEASLKRSDPSEISPFLRLS
jgi:hypothetical protein